MAQEAQAQVVVGPLEMSIEEGGKKKAGNWVISHINHKVQQMMEAEINLHMQQNLAPLCDKLNAQLEAQLTYDLRQRAAAVTLSNRDAALHDDRRRRAMAPSSS